MKQTIYKQLAFSQIKHDILKRNKHINWSNSATFVCLSQDRTYISIVISLFYVQCVEIRGDCSFS